MGSQGLWLGFWRGSDWAADLHGRGGSIVTAAADTPFFPRDLVARLMRTAEGQAYPLVLATTPRSGRCSGVEIRRGQKDQYRHPTFGLWPVALRDDLRAALNDGLRKVVMWTDGHGGREAMFPAEPFDPFFNVNTPDDLEQAQKNCWSNWHEGLWRHRLEKRR